MLISCKCLNLILNSTTISNPSTNNDEDNDSEHQNPNQKNENSKDSNNKFINGETRNNNNDNDNDNMINKSSSLSSSSSLCTSKSLQDLIQHYNIKMEELKKFQNSKSNKIYDECLKFFNQANGPLNNLHELIAQQDLIYKVPINSWILYYCINCNTIAYAKKQKHISSTSSSPTILTPKTNNNYYLINSHLLTNQEELNRLKNHQSYSDTFGILINDRPLTVNLNKNKNIIGGFTNNGQILSSSSTSSGGLNNCNKDKQIRFKNLTHVFNNRLQKEIYETDERIRRYTDHQFALLKSYREKSEQEYQILVSLINQVPDELKMIDAINIDLESGIVTTSTASQQNSDDMITDQNQQQLQQSTSNDISSLPSSTSLFTLKQQQILNLDTPPATPDSTPMSVGNSPTFRQQSTTSSATNIFGGQFSNRVTSLVNNSGNLITGNDSIINGIIGNSLDSDCLFEIDGMETTRDLSGINASSGSTAISDIEETEDAEDALGELDIKTIQIPRTSTIKKSSVMNIAKSLPISISTVPEPRFYVNELDDDDDEIQIDTNIDIAASIKALAKSVHGDTVFGDLPRPRFSTQI